MAIETWALEDEEHYVPFYELGIYAFRTLSTYFRLQTDENPHPLAYAAHMNFVGMSETHGPVVLSVVKEDTPVSRCILRTPRGDERIMLDPSRPLHSLAEMRPSFRDAAMSPYAFTYLLLVWFLALVFCLFLIFLVFLYLRFVCSR